MYTVKNLKNKRKNNNKKKKRNSYEQTSFLGDVKKPKALSLLKGRGVARGRVCKNYIVSETRRCFSCKK